LSWVWKLPPIHANCLIIRADVCRAGQLTNATLGGPERCHQLRRTSRPAALHGEPSPAIVGRVYWCHPYPLVLHSPAPVCDTHMGVVAHLGARSAKVTTENRENRESKKQNNRDARDLGVAQSEPRNRHAPTPDITIRTLDVCPRNVSEYHRDYRASQWQDDQKNANQQQKNPPDNAADKARNCRARHWASINRSGRRGSSIYGQRRGILLGKWRRSICCRRHRILWG